MDSTDKLAAMRLSLQLHVESIHPLLVLGTHVNAAGFVESVSANANNSLIIQLKNKLLASSITAFISSLCRY